MSQSMRKFVLASFLAFVPAMGFAHDGVDHSKEPGHAADAEGGAATLGNLEVSGAYARATLPKAPVGGAYFVLKNQGDAADRLVSITAPVGKEVQIHEMAMQGDVMQMRQLPDGLEIGAKSEIAFAPGGYHLMIMGLTEPLVEGEMLEMEMTFEKAGQVKVPFQIQKINAKAGDAPCEHGADGGHGDHGAAQSHGSHGSSEDGK